MNLITTCSSCNRPPRCFLTALDACFCLEVMGFPTASSVLCLSVLLVRNLSRRGWLFKRIFTQLTDRGLFGQNQFPAFFQSQSHSCEYWWRTQPSGGAIRTE
ncbi:unnamed protein product [Malus baccata var. baccata]